MRSQYKYAGNLRVAEIEGSTATIFHKDHLGSSIAMTDSAGAKVEGTEYLPFGGMRSHTGSEVSDYKFTDQELDSESGLYNYDARLYDPVIGRFISPDTVVPEWNIPQSLNRFSYCKNNPLLYIDPSGHYSEDEKYPFTAYNGIKAHNLIFRDMKIKFDGLNIDQGSLKVYNMEFDRPINLMKVFFIGGSRNRPDIIDHTTKTIIEIKPITHISDHSKFLKSDTDQLEGYLSETGYELGDASKFFPLSESWGSIVGDIYDKDGDEWQVSIYTKKNRKGFLYYTLEQTGRNKIEIEDEARRRARENAIMENLQRFFLPSPFRKPERLRR